MMPGNFRMMGWCVAAGALLAFGLLASGCKKKTKPAPPPEVLYITVTTTNLPIYEEWIGTLDGYVNAQIRAQVTGYLQKQDYAEGSEVRTNDLLFEIDPRPFKAVLDQAESRLAQDKAQLEKTDLDVKRYTPLVKEEALSQETLDNALQAFLGAKAQVQADEAAVESARLNLGFTRITSPVDGVAGTALAQIGDLLSASGPVLTTVSTIDPIRVYFQANEKSYLDFWRRFVGSNDVAAPVLDLILSDGSVFPQKGKFFFAGRQIDPTTGTLQIAGLFPNPDLTLRPGQYGMVRALVDMKTNAVVIPQRAVIESQGAYHVWVVISDNNTNKSHLVRVKVGRQVNGIWVIDDGLKGGEHLIVEGTLKAKEGTVVNPQPYTPAPAAGDSSTNSAH
jgi:membrane fusion protein (multidrug efflux system)